LVQKRGLQFIEKEASNFELPAFPGLFVEESHWRRHQATWLATPIDFFVQVLGMNFHRIIKGAKQHWKRPLAS
jgi:hypothetical protein